MAWHEADVAVVGGSFAGAAAALQVARGRRRVLMFDTGVTRNRFSAESHGFEAADRPTVVLMTGPWSLHHARILGDWTENLTLLANGHELGSGDRADLARRGVPVTEGRVLRVEHEGGLVRAAVLEGGAVVPAEVVYLNSRFEPSADLAQALGCAMTESPLGSHVAMDTLGRTSIEGVFAAGDLVRPFYNATASAAEGVRAGSAAHQSLMIELPR